MARIRVTRTIVIEGEEKAVMRQVHVGNNFMSATGADQPVFNGTQGWTDRPHRIRQWGSYTMTEHARVVERLKD